MELGKIYNENCLDTMKKMPDNYVDMVLTSPPYDDLRNYNGYTLPFEKIVSELFRVLKVGGVIIWVVGDKTEKGSESGTSFKHALFFKEIGFNIHDTMIYYKNNPMPTTGNRYHQHFEYMFAFSKGNPKTFNPITEPTKYSGLANMKNRGKEGTLNYKKVERTKEKKLVMFSFIRLAEVFQQRIKLLFSILLFFRKNLQQIKSELGLTKEKLFTTRLWEAELPPRWRSY